MMHITRTLALAASLFYGLVAQAVLAQEQLYHNFTGYTFSQNDNQVVNLNSFTHMVVKDGRILALGNTNLESEYAAAELVNLHGKTLLPGLIDAHAHIPGLGENLLQVDLRGINNRTATVAKVANYADGNLELEWVVGRGWNQEIWPIRNFPNRNDLDAVISDRPVYLVRVDGHAAWANSHALELAGIDNDTPDPDGGQIIRDDEGAATGILVDTAMQLVSDLIPPPTQETRLQALELAQQHILQHGLTQVIDAGVSKEQLQDYRDMNEDGDLKLRVNAMIASSDPDLTELLAAGVYTSDNHRLRIGNVKMYGDGALGSRGARMIEPYTDDPENYGLLVTPAERVRSLFAQIHQAGFQISYHAIGDYSNTLALDEFARLVEQEDEADNLAAYRHRIEHAQIVQVDDIPRFQALGVIPSMQPTHATSDMNMAEERIGSERIAGAYAWRSFLDAGSKIAAGSDFPVELVNPFYGIHAAVTRQDRNGDPVEGWYPEQALTLLETLRSFTVDAAYSGFTESYSGTLEPGKYADFIVVDRDPFKTNSQDLWRTKVLATYVGGERVFTYENR